MSGVARPSPEPTSSSRGDAGTERRRLTGEQQALRRIATLVAAGAAPAQLFATVAEEVAAVMRVPIVTVGRYGDDDDTTLTVVAAWADRPHALRAGTAWPVESASVAARVLATGRPATLEDDVTAGRMSGARPQERGVVTTSAAPIMVDGRVWGIIAVSSPDPPPAEHVEQRLADFTVLVATAIANSEAREDVQRLADEQAALRRVATLVAEGKSPGEVFAAVAREIALVLKMPRVAMFRYEPRDTATVVGCRGAHPFQPGTTWPLDSVALVAQVRETGRPVQAGVCADLAGRDGDAAQRAGATAAVGAAIVVEGSLWGAVCASVGEGQPLPADAERRLSAFTALVGTAFSNTQAREDLQLLADEQAALRRVATLVAQRLPAGELFDAVAGEVGRLLGTDLAGMARYERDDAVALVATWSAAGEHHDVSGSWPLHERGLLARIRRTRRSARLDDWTGVPGRTAELVRDDFGVRSSVGSPIIVEGDVWGALFVHSTHTEPLPADVDARVAGFTELVATAISNSEAQAEVRRLADQQAALRRVATLVARERPAAEVFAAVAEEVAKLLGIDVAGMVRYETDGTVTLVSTWGEPESSSRVGVRLPLDGVNISSRVLRTGRPARMDEYSEATGPFAASNQRLGVATAVGSPIVVEGQVWGAMIAASREPASLPADTETRMAEFTDLAAAAISNLQARSDLAASRARIVEAADAERRRVVRDLHDGAQSRLVHSVIALERARRSDDMTTARPLVAEGITHARLAIDELRELARGIHPAILTHSGLGAAVEVLAQRAPLPVEVAIAEERYPAPVESAAYFVAAEALTNVVKYAHATRARITAARTASALHLAVEDDGVGGAAPGNGLDGLRDRVAALDGRLGIDSPPGGGTRIQVEIPLPAGG